jgi:hypothetical protein
MAAIRAIFNQGAGGILIEYKQGRSWDFGGPGENKISGPFYYFFRMHEMMKNKYF